MEFTYRQENLKDILKSKPMYSLDNLKFRYSINTKSKSKKENLEDEIYSVIMDKEVLKDNSIILYEEFNEIDLWDFGNIGKKLEKLVELGYAHKTYKNGGVVFTLAYEIIQITLRWNKDLSREIERYKLIKSYVFACVNLYGVIEIDQFFKIFHEQNPMEKQLDYEELEKQIKRYKKFIRHPERYNDLIINEDLPQIKGKLKDVMIQRKNKEFYVPCREELLKYEDEYYVEKNHQYFELEKFINSKVEDEMLASHLLEEFTETLRYIDISIDCVISEFKCNNIDIDSPDEIEKLNYIYTDLKNNTRKFINKGYTNNEIDIKELRSDIK